MWRYEVLVVLLIAAGCSGGSSSTPTPTSDAVLRFPVEGASMEPTFSNGESVDVLRYTSPVQTGDIIVFVAPTSPNRNFLKRVIAGPGDRVQIIQDEGLVIVNGETIGEPYVQGVTRCGAWCEFSVPPTIATGEVIVPNGGISPRPQPTAPGDDCGSAACYLVMGDNRQNSSDSRQGWLVPVDNIIGYVEAPR
jgi:signal peptidase I